MKTNKTLRNAAEVAGILGSSATFESTQGAAQAFENVEVCVQPRLLEDYADWWKNEGAALWLKYGGKLDAWGRGVEFELPWLDWLRFMFDAGLTEGFFAHVGFYNLPFEWYAKEKPQSAKLSARKG